MTGWPPFAARLEQRSRCGKKKKVLHAASGDAVNEKGKICTEISAMAWSFIVTFPIFWA